MRRLAFAFLTCIVSPALACSVAPGYRVPTTLELAGEADRIVIAVPFGQRDADTGEPEALFAELFVLKSDGREPFGSAIGVPGLIADVGTPVTPSDPRELVRAHPETYSGGCNRYIFGPRTFVLLFLKRQGDRYRALSYAFARTAEDAKGFNSLWAKAVREYVAIAALPPKMRRARMAARQAILRRRGDADSRAIADDLRAELTGPDKPLRETLPPAPWAIR
ncbi:hypothetical protein ABS767_17485 [Sphingomonas sp. ST-64]|uniref:Lipoprotein n=1 Tax=Sphingomonas plantiphila TaxID=3163295 RepID=A0ABW8YTN7_9SPHN